jgi:hypothetical protein
METKIFDLKGSIISLVLLFAFGSVNADDLENIEINFLPAKVSGLNKSEIPNLDPLEGVDISFKKIFSYQNNVPMEIGGRSEVRSENLSQGNHKKLSLGPNEFVEVIGIDKSRKLFNGSIIVKFKQVPDLYWFASQNNLQFVSDLSDINRGVFKIGNIYDSEEIIRNLQNKVEVQSVELDVIDPSVEVN